MHDKIANILLAACLLALIVASINLMRMHSAFVSLEIRIAELEASKPAPPVAVCKDYTVTVTAYSQEMFPGPAANGTYPEVGKTIAVSRDLKHLMGKKVLVDGFGEVVVNDLMNERFTRRIDVFTLTTKEAVQFGIKRGVALAVPTPPRE